MKNVTVGQLLINEALPEQYRDYSRVIDKKNIKDLLDRLASETDSNTYKQVVTNLFEVGKVAAHSTGSSLSIKDLRPSPATEALIDKLRKDSIKIINDDRLTEEQRNDAVKQLVMARTQQIEDVMYEDALKSGNAFAIQVASGSRGGKADMRSLLTGDLLVTDQDDKIIPVPLINGYVHGLTPGEFWAGSYGARKGTVSTKFATAEAGFLGKQLAQAAHREVVTEDDCGTDRGIPVTANDPDNVGTVLQLDVGEYKAGTPIDSRMLKAMGDKPIIVRSPITCEAKNGICAKCAGIRERGSFPAIGDNVGIVASQSLSEKLSQSSLNVKHGGGRAKTDHKENQITGFKLVNQLVQVPKAFAGGAAVSKIDGVVREIQPAPQGGFNVFVGSEMHHVPHGLDPSVKPGDRVEAGDLLSDGIPNPSEIVKHRGIGEGRLAFMNILRDAFKSSGMSANRRNIELLTRGLVNHVYVTDMDGPDGALPGDIVEYTTLERNYKPRNGTKPLNVGSAKGKYLEKPTLYYSIGTRITPRVEDTLKKAGIKSVYAHDDPPSFQPKMVRAMETMSHVPDWQVRLSGWYLQRGMLEALHEDIPSEVTGVSFVPGLARGKDFGKELKRKGIY